jgi:hypothetical protein
LPLLKEIVADLEEMQASDDAKSFVYFTKESHIYTLLNCILEGGIETKIARSSIPELDYLSQICFELYESETTPLPPTPKPVKAAPVLQTLESGLELSTPGSAPCIDSEATVVEPPQPEQTFAYSIRITISPGCHTYDPLDVQLDSKHCIGCAPRRSLTQHMDWKVVIETLRAKFHTVKLPKSFLAINLSESHTFHKRFEEGENGETKEVEEKTLSKPSSLLLPGDATAEQAAATLPDQPVKVEGEGGIGHEEREELRAALRKELGEEEGTETEPSSGVGTPRLSQLPLANERATKGSSESMSVATGMGVSPMPVADLPEGMTIKSPGQQPIVVEEVPESEKDNVQL